MPRNTVWVVVALLAVGLALPLLTGAMVGGWGYGGMGRGWGFGPMGPGMMGPGMMGGWAAGGPGTGWEWPLAALLGTLGGLAFWAAVIVGIVLLVRWALGTGGLARPGAEPSALEILKRRYAEGQIDQPTYERVRQELER